ncbi:MAG: hydantoinase B/oxoprolinase family protein, partial [Candidatus Thorarchaeota archaeon]
ATRGITRSCVFYVLRYLLKDINNIPTNYGLFKPIELILPDSSIVNSYFPYATSSGNVETSQRIVDVLFKALSPIQSFDVPAASQGTMNNILIGGLDSLKNSYFSYYETIGGGTGASMHSDGCSAIHSHMTNTLNTPIESIENSYPIRINRYELRVGSGGKGLFSGGDGIIREYQILTDSATVSLQTERRFSTPYGLYGGENGKAGLNILISENGTRHILKDKISFEIKKGDVVIIETPGGGGYGTKESKG